MVSSQFELFLMFHLWGNWPNLPWLIWHHAVEGCPDFPWNVEIWDFTFWVS